MNVKEILHKYLVDNGHQGLCTDGCGCGVKDLIPCESCFDNCVPAKLAIATEDDHDYDVGDEIFVPSENVSQNGGE